MFWLGLLAGWIASSLIVGLAIGRWFRWLREKNESLINDPIDADK